MSYFTNEPNGELYIGNVKWSNDYKNVLLFATRVKRNEFLEATLTKIKNNVIFINPNGYVDIRGKIKDIETYNYIYYKNDSDISDTHYCCFITDYEYIAPRTTRIYLELDVFQMYHYTTDYYRSYIERAIVSSAENNANTNYLPEPVSAPLNYEDELQTIFTEAKWQPYWVLHMASRYSTADEKYHYEGVGTQNTFGEYGRFIDNANTMASMIEMYGRISPQEIAQRVGASQGQNTWADWVKDIFMATTGAVGLAEKVLSVTSVAELQDHRSELIGVYAIPTWLKEAFDGDVNYADNRRTSTSPVTLTLNTSSLANGYTPRNKKLLTSVCRGYVLANRTGLKIPFKPELFTGTPTITLYGITMAIGGYQYSISNYSDRQLAHGEVSYASERRVGYDANTGLNKVINTIGAGNQIIQSAGSIVAGAAAENPLAVVGGASSLVGSAVSAVDAIGQQEGHIGANGDLLRITGGRPVLRWFEVNPSVSECQAIDNFFDMFGYTIHEHKSPTSYFSNRNHWNYIKTQNINLRGNCPANYENKLKSIFDGGVTIWHVDNNNSDSYFGDYSNANT